MMNRSNCIWPILLSVSVFCILTFGQEKEQFDKANLHGLKDSSHSIFDEIEKGISSGKIETFSRFFNPQIYLSLSNGVNGYYSSNQAFYVLAEYFKTHQIVSFKFDDIQEEDSGMYATGSYNFLVKGKRDFAQVYISLKHSNKKWKINQITIN